MRSMHVYRSSCANAVSDEGRPVDDRYILADFNQLRDRVGVQETEIGRLDLPRLVLSTSRKLRQIYRQKWSIDQTVNQMVNQLAQH